MERGMAVRQFSKFGTVTTGLALAIIATSAQTTYSWSFEFISAFDFARRWSTDTNGNLFVPNRENEEFKKIVLNVQLKDVHPQEALQALARCTGYVVETRGEEYIVTMSEHARPERCDGFEVLDAQ